MTDFHDRPGFTRYKIEVEWRKVTNGGDFEEEELT